MNYLKINFFVLLLLFYTYSKDDVNKTKNDKKNFKIAAYNVEFGKAAKPEQFAKALKPYNFDVITFNEAPANGLSYKIAKKLEMKYVYEGKISSANHKDKYKSIISKTPLVKKNEVLVKGLGWGPASAVNATTEIFGKKISIYSLHLPSGGNRTRQTKQYDLAKHIRNNDKSRHIIVSGDFNCQTNFLSMKSFIKNKFNYTWNSLTVDVIKKKTWNAYNKANEGVIDHILYRFPDKENENYDEEIKVTDGGILYLNPLLSDHHPVWAEFTIQEKK